MPPYSLYPCLLLFYIGYLFAWVHRDCGGAVDTLREQSGRIQFSWSPENYEVESRVVRCTWLLRARFDQELRLAAVSVAAGSRLCVAFERSAARRLCVSGDSNLFSGTGSAILSWTPNETVKGTQSVHLFFTQWDDARNSSADMSEFWTSSALMNFTTRAGTPSSETSGTPGATARSWFSQPSASELLHKNKINSVVRVRRQDSGRGTAVAAFQSSPSATSLWFSPSVSAGSDKEMAPLSQEATDNNPDMSVKALGVSDLTTTLGSIAEGDGQGRHVARLHQVDSEDQDVRNEPELRLVPESSTNSSKYTTGAEQLTQNQGPSTQGQFTVVAPRHGGALLPLPSAPAESAIASSSLYSSVTAASIHKTPLSPNLEEFGLNMDRSTYATFMPDHLSGEYQHDVGTVHFETTSLPSEDVPSEADTHNKPSNSGSDEWRRIHSRSPVHHLASMLADNPRVEIYVQDDSKSSALKNGASEIKELHSVSPSIPSNTAELLHEMNASTASENPWVKESTSVGNGELFLTSKLEETTYRGGEPDQMITGDIYQSTKWLQTNTEALDFQEFSSLKSRGISEVEILKTSIPSVSGAGVATLPDSTEKFTNFEDTEDSMQSTHPVVPHSQTVSNTAYEDDTRTHLTSFTDSETTSVANGKQEWTNVGKTDLPFFTSHRTTLHPKSVAPHYTKIQTKLPEISSSTILNSYNSMSISGTYTSEFSSLSESTSKSSHDFDRSTSPLPPLSNGGSESADYTLHTTASPHMGPTTLEDKFRTSAQGTPGHHLERTSISNLASSSPMLSPGTVAPGSTQEGTYLSSEGLSETEGTRTVLTSVVYPHTLPPMHTVTVSSDPEGTPLSVTGAPSTGAFPSISPGQEVSTLRGFISPSPDSTVVTPKVHEKFSFTVQGDTKRTKLEACPHCTPSPVSTISRTVTMPVDSTSYSSVSTTQQKIRVALHSSHPPRVTSVASTTVLDSATTIKGVSSASTQTSMSRTQTSSRSSTKPVHGRVFIVEDQPVIIKEETVQLLLQIVLATEGQRDADSAHLSSLKEEAVAKVDSFLQRAPGFQDLQVSWISGGAVVQSIATFDTAGALSWLGVPGSLLHVTGLRDAVNQGLYVSGAKVENITVGGPQSELCSWLFRCPSGFQCVLTSRGNASCTSRCHTHYCKNNGICTHHHGQPPMCQCPVGEDFWFMGRQCDSQMTRQRLVGLCLGVLFAVAMLMGAVSFLVIRHFKAMLVQAKVDQTRSRYRPGCDHYVHLNSDISGFVLTASVSERALDRTCCYHDDTLSVVSTFHGSGTHLNTIYAHGSQYNWDLSDVSVNEFMADSGKASDLSVCSWPIEPIQWTPFPLLQQLGAQRPVRTSRPRSYCEGMELVDLEKTWTA
ncbi:hypothetical protein GN956_G17919 [Arapaima gigas]